MANFFLDNKDLQFHLQHPLMRKIVALKERNYTLKDHHELAPQNFEDAMDNYRRVHTNAMMNARMLREFCPLDQAARELLERAMVRLDLSARAYDRIVKVARTIADLEGTADIGAAHLAEAINYRSLDRGSWGR